MRKRKNTCTYSVLPQQARGVHVCIKKLNKITHIPSFLGIYNRPDYGKASATDAYTLFTKVSLIP